MWILLNNQPVCVFNIKNVSGIIKLTPELFYRDNNDIRKESVLSHTYILTLISCIGRKWNVQCH